MKHDQLPVKLFKFQKQISKKKSLKFKIGHK